MILGRPTNLWLGFTTSTLAVVQILLVNVAKLDPVLTATLLGAVGLLLGSAIGLIANQPPTVNPGDKILITTPSGTPNWETTVAAPPAASPPPVPAP